MTVYDKPGEEILEAIAAYTGLGYLIEPDGVLLYDPSSGSSHSTEPDLEAALAADPYVAVIEIPLKDGTAFRWLVRWSELPDDLRQRRDLDLQRAFDAVRRMGTNRQP